MLEQAYTNCIEFMSNLFALRFQKLGCKIIHPKRRFIHAFHSDTQFRKRSKTKKEVPPHVFVV